MMYSGRDSGYSEHGNSNNPDVLQKVSYSLSREIPFINPLNEFSSDDKIKDTYLTGSSCRALKHAVSNLSRLDDFISERIGRGFFSEVFKVKHRVTGKVMVLKMNLLRSNRPNMLKEVQLMNQLSHPNILKFMGACVHEGQLHALTEYINGGSLESLIQSKQELTYSVRMKLALDMAKGMKYLHSRNVFHRDFTSKNVLVRKNELNDNDMTAVVGDFGLAAKIPSPGTRLPTVGSPWWMSPECLKGRCYDQRSDVFSYGIILCELIARIDADPDLLPRTSNFGLDYLAFVEICSQQDTPPPPEFLKLAFSSCNVEPKNRPTFSDIVKFLEDYPRVMFGHVTTKIGCCLTEAKSEEVLQSLKLISNPPNNTSFRNNHRKLAHKRSLSDEIGTIVFPSKTTPSDKARCHSRASFPPLKEIGESMCQEDPHYRPSPSKSNPFASLSKFKGVKKILSSTNSTDLFSSCFEVPTPYYRKDGEKPYFYEEEILTGRSKPFKFARSATSYKGGDASDSGRKSSISVEPVLKPSQIKNAKLVFRSKSSPKPIAEYASHLNSLAKNAAAEKLNRNRVWKCEESEKQLAVASVNKDACGDAPERKPVSLPSSPTFTRRSAVLTDKRLSFTSKMDDEDCVTLRPPWNKIPSVFLHASYKAKAYLNDCCMSNFVGYPLRSCSSSSNISNLEEMSNNMFLPIIETSTGAMARRRGSCESGFYSSLGDDFYASGHHNRASSSFTLSSSSATSSLFLDSNGDDCSSQLVMGAAARCPLVRYHHGPDSSAYTDSSEDISSLASSEPPPTLDEQQKSRQISKIVEYFEKKQTGCRPGPASGSKWKELAESSRVSSSLHPNARRNWLHAVDSSIRSLDYCTRRKLFEKPLSSGGSHVVPKRSSNQRLIVCEGAVKSKLQLFDKKIQRGEITNQRP